MTTLPLAATGESPVLRIATVAIDPRTVSPAGPVWLPLPARTGHQVPLIDLDDALPDPWHTYRQEQARKPRGRRERADVPRRPRRRGLGNHPVKLTLCSPLECPRYGHEFDGAAVTA